MRHQKNGAAQGGSVLECSLPVFPGSQVLANHQRNPEDNGVVELPQVKTRKLADLFQTVHQGVAVDEQLPGSLGHVQAVLKELVDGEQGFLIQRIQRILLENFLQENLTQSGGQLVDETPDAQILIVHDALLGVKDLAHLDGGLGFLVGIRQLPQILR